MTRTSSPNEQATDLSVERLRELLSYDPTTGEFLYRVRVARRTPAGSLAGSVNNEGYRHIRVDGRAYKAHRLAWLHVHGTWPGGMLDHIDGDRDNNRIANLREATRSQNLANSRPYRANSKYHKGINRRTSGLWDARISHNGKCHFLGCFKTEGEAVAAYASAARNFYGEYARIAAA
jgi:hypothetical protein